MIFWCIQPTCLDPSSLICDIVLVVISCSLSELLKSLLRYYVISVTFHNLCYSVAALVCQCYTAVLQLDSFQSILCILLTQSE